MHRVLRFRPNLRATLAGDELVFLIGEHERFLLKGRLYELVVPLIDGRRTEWQIIEALERQLAPPDVYFALTNLEKKGYLVEASAAQPAETAALWYELGVDAGLAVERLAATRCASTPGCASS
jgi:oxazoline/thiazoline synthase